MLRIRILPCAMLCFISILGAKSTSAQVAVITQQPQNQTAVVGKTATFTITISDPTCTVMWQRNGSNIVSGADLVSHTTPPVALADNGAKFGVAVYNCKTAANAHSNTATLTVTTAAVVPTITAQPANRTVTAGQTATFSVVASGIVPLTYQWQRNGANIGGATSSSYTTLGTTSSDNGATFRVVVSNSAGRTTSNSATLTVSSNVTVPSITTQPPSQKVPIGQTATFAVVAGGTTPLNHQWQKNGSNITGATAASYTTPATTSADNGSKFQVVVSNSAGSVMSSAATLTVAADTTPPTVSITSPTSGATISGTITVTASASDNVAVASMQLLVDGTDVGTADTTSPYTFSLNTSGLSNGSHSLTAVATDSSGNQATSAAVSITVSNQGTGAEPAYANNGAGCPINTVPGGPTDSVTSYNCPLPNPTGAGNLLVIWVRYSNANSPTISFTDNIGGNTYMQATSCLDNSNGLTESRLYYVQNVKAGVNLVSVHFSASSSYVQMQPYEFYHVATSAALDQAACQVSRGTSISTGALPDLSASGDLVVQFSFADNVAAIGSCAVGAQSDVAWTMRAALIASPEPMCFQYGVYGSTASFSPTMTFKTSANYISLAAAFKAASAGTAPPSGIRVAYIQHDDGGEEQNPAFSIQLPVSGNLIAELTTAGCASNSLSSCAYAKSMSGTDTWTHVGSTYMSNTGSSQEAIGSIWYAKNVSPGLHTLTMAMNGRPGSTFPLSWIMYDIVGASSNPLDLGFGGAGNGLASISNVSSTTSPVVTFTATPSEPNEVILAEAGYEWDTFTGLTSPTGARFLSAYYNAETNYSWCDLNGGWGLFYNGSSTAPETWTWRHDSSQYPGTGRGLALGVAFK
jgi:hypothetical protein